MCGRVCFGLVVFVFVFKFVFVFVFVFVFWFMGVCFAQREGARKRQNLRTAQGKAYSIA